MVLDLGFALVLAFGFGFGLNFSSLELRKYVDSVVQVGGFGWVRDLARLMISQSLSILSI